MAITNFDKLRMHCVDLDEKYESLFADLVWKMKDDDSDFLSADFETENYCVVYTLDRVYIATLQRTPTQLYPILVWVSAKRNPTE